MANAAAIRFCKSLFASFGKWKIADDVKDAYQEKLSKWRLREAQWSRALSRIVAESEDLPPLSRIYEYLKAVSVEDMIFDDPVRMLFDRGDQQPFMHSKPTGKRHPKTGQMMYAPVDVNPSDPPTAPGGSANVRLIIPPAKQAHCEPCSRQEARGAFLAGWLKAGAPGERAVAMFNAIQNGGSAPNETRSRTLPTR